MQLNNYAVKVQSKLSCTQTIYILKNKCCRIYFETIFSSKCTSL